MNFVDVLQNIGFNPLVFLFNVINFAVFAFLLKKYLFTKVETILEERRRVIQKSQDDARELEIRLNKAKDEAEYIIASANKERDGIIANANIDAKKQAEAILSKAKVESDVILSQAISNAKRRETEILVSVKDKLADIVIDKVKEEITK